MTCQERGDLGFGKPEVSLNSWHEEKSPGTKAPNHTAPASPPGTWLQLTVERRWSEGGFQLLQVCVCVCVCVGVRVRVCE